MKILISVGFFNAISRSVRDERQPLGVISSQEVASPVSKTGTLFITQIRAILYGLNRKRLLVSWMILIKKYNRWEERVETQNGGPGL